MNQRSDRQEGRYPGQGWFLEDETKEWLHTRNRRVVTRVPFWGVEVDIVALRDDQQRPRKLLGSAKDYFCKERITPATLWRLIALAMTARAEPLLIHNHRAELTDKAQRIAEKWRVRIATDRDVMNDAPLPEPERPPHGYNLQYPSLLTEDVDVVHEWAPDYYSQLDEEEAYEKLDYV